MRSQPRIWSVSLTWLANAAVDGDPLNDPAAAMVWVLGHVVYDRPG
ncbi:MAG: hypothetical protein WBF75_12670 [Pseudonocardiaceae bacterium]